MSTSNGRQTRRAKHVRTEKGGQTRSGLSDAVNVGVGFFLKSASESGAFGRRFWEGVEERGGGGEENQRMMSLHVWQYELAPKGPRGVERLSMCGIVVSERDVEQDSNRAGAS
jgi:hypothetical protein